ncbi:MAG: hemolysin III family protein [Hyphomonadaceae bacterium]|nr:hemolysin III family protein [Hyphomonadaceae bacterium]
MGFAMNASLVEADPFSLYRTSAERNVDRWVHVAGVTGAAIAGLVLLGLAIWQGGVGRVSAVTIYALCWIAMLTASMIYNLARRPELRSRLRRLDHAAIFLMIAGSYTPFTTQRFEGWWAIGMTAGVWAIALGCAVGKLFAPGLSKKIWIAAYLLLGWIALAALKPFLEGVSPAALTLLVVGGAIYTAGVCFYVWERLPFRRAIWHMFVLAASGVHYAAVLVGVVLAAPPV